MNRATIEKALDEINGLVVSGKLLDAFEKFYAEEVVMQENLNPPVVGKDANRLREIEFLNNIEEFRSASVTGVGVGDDISFVIWNYDYTHKQWGIKNYTQVSVQNWKDGRIIKEQFFYGN
jgi:hypothetical protein